MKTIVQFITLMFLFFAASSCENDADFKTESVSCNLDYSDHIKNKEFQSIADKYVKKGFPGLALSVYMPDDGRWEGSAGYADIENKIKMTPCNLQYAASIQKTYIAVLILQLIDEGILSPDTKIETYIPDNIKKYIANNDKITIENLLLHNSGLEDNFGVDFLTAFYNDPMKTYTTEEFLKFLENTKPVGDPGINSHHYSDANYMLLSMIIDNITGDHVQFMQERIINHLNLSSTYYHNTTDYPKPAGLVSSYWDTYGDGRIENISDYQNNSTKCFYGSGGLIVTPYDMDIFINAVFKGDLLSDELKEKILVKKLPNDNKDWANEYYGYGLMIIEDKEHGNWYGHSGRHVGASAFVFYNPEHDVSVSIMTNIGSFLTIKYTELVFYYLWNDLVDEIFR